MVVDLRRADMGMGRHGQARAGMGRLAWAGMGWLAEISIWQDCYCGQAGRHGPQILLPLSDACTDKYAVHATAAPRFLSLVIKAGVILALGSSNKSCSSLHRNVATAGATAHAWFVVSSLPAAAVAPLLLPAAAVAATG